MEASISKAFLVEVYTQSGDFASLPMKTEYEAMIRAKNQKNAASIRVIHPGGYVMYWWIAGKGEILMPAKGTMAGSQQGDFVSEEVKAFLAEADVPFDIKVANGPEYNENLSKKDKKGNVTEKVYNHTYYIVFNEDSRKRITKAMQVGSVPVLPDHMTLSFSLREEDLDDPENFRVKQFVAVSNEIETNGIAHNACLVPFTSRQWNKTGYKLDWWIE